MSRSQNPNPCTSLSTRLRVSLLALWAASLGTFDAQASAPSSSTDPRGQSTGAKGTQDTEPSEDWELPALLDALADPKDYSRRYKAYRILSERKAPRIWKLLEPRLLSMPIASLSYATSLLVQAGTERTEKIHQRLRKSKRPILRLIGALYFLRQRDAKAESEVLSALREVSPNPDAHSFALGRLYYVRSPRITAFEVESIRPPYHQSVFRARLYYLNGIDDRSCLDKLETVAKDEVASLAIRAMALAYLVRMGDAASAKSLGELLGKPGVSLSSSSSFLSRAEQLPKAFLEALLAHAERTKSSYEKRTAATLLGQFGHRAALPFLRKAMESEDRYLAEAATEAVQKLNGGFRREDLLKQLASKKANIAIKAADTLRKLGDGSGLDRVLEVLKNKELRSYEVLRVLAGFRHPKAVDALIEALGDKDQSARYQALSGIQNAFRALFPYKRFDFGKVGYRADGPAAPRAAAILAIRKWWAAHRSALPKSG